MYDPDTLKGTFIHWLKINITGNDIKTGNIILPYKAPSPPKGTGIHRYIFELYEQTESNNSETIDRVVTSINKIKQKLSLNKIISKIQFRSQNDSGGKKRKSKKQIKKRKTRRIIRR